jgi:hypothetical protein
MNRTCRKGAAKTDVRVAKVKGIDDFPARAKVNPVKGYIYAKARKSQETGKTVSSLDAVKLDK